MAKKNAKKRVQAARKSGSYAKSKRKKTGKGKSRSAGSNKRGKSKSKTKKQREVDETLFLLEQEAKKRRRVKPKTKKQREIDETLFLLDQEAKKKRRVKPKTKKQRRKKKRQLKILTVRNSHNLNTLVPFVLRYQKIYKENYYTFIHIDNRVEKTTDKKYILTLIQDEGQELYSIIDEMASAGEEIDSPWFYIPVQEDAYKKEKIRLTFNFASKKIYPPNPELFETYRKLYLR